MYASISNAVSHAALLRSPSIRRREGGRCCDASEPMLRHAVLVGLETLALPPPL